MSYERTAEHSNATRLQKVPNTAMRAGDFSASPLPIFDSLSAPIGSEGDRIPFENNIIPESRIASASRTLANMTDDWHLPNLQGTGPLGLNQNYLAGITYAFDRHQIDGKTNFNFTDKWTMFARLSFFYFDQVNPGAYGILSGQSVHPTNFRTDNGFGPTYRGTISTTYVIKPNLIFDAYFGSMPLDSNAFAANLDQNIGLDLLGIPGTNGDGVPGEAGSFYGGMPRMRFDAGFGNLGYQATSPFIGHDFQHQIAANGNWTKGNHNVRFGMDVFLSNINQEVANFPGGDAPAGGFRFRSNTTSRPGTGVNDYNAIASFMLGLPREAARNFLTGRNLQTRSVQYAGYIRDRWQVRPNLTMSYGTRWEFFPFPRRPDRGLERRRDRRLGFWAGGRSTPWPRCVRDDLRRRRRTGSLNSQGSGQFADCLAAPVTLGTPDLWWDPSSFIDPAELGGPDRFGTCGPNILRGPGLINVDMGLFRKFEITERMDLQFRAEAFNISNTPHFNNPNSNVASSGFGQVTSMQNTGREGLDQRVFRFGLRLGF